jgi:hypothetical protein
MNTKKRNVYGRRYVPLRRSVSLEEIGLKTEMVSVLRKSVAIVALNELRI